ncbi:MAG: hypothetical protein ACLTSX_12860 [Collinsella sp.]
MQGRAATSSTFSDTGCGMSEEFVQKVFEPFTRANDSRVTKVERAPVWACPASCVLVVNLMNGTIDVKSVSSARALPSP